MRRLLSPSIAEYKKRYFRHDIIAALTVTAISIPESLGFAAIVGLPPVTGLYTAVFAPIVFGLIAKTRRLVVGADSATAALVASGALLVAQAGTAGYVNAVALIGLLTAAILVGMSVFKLGFLADLISRPVLVGFLAGVGVQLIVTRVPAMLGIHASGSLWQHILAVAQHIGTINGLTITISVLVVGMIILTRKSVVPGELAGIVLAILFAIVFHVSDYGVKLVGALPGGLPGFAHPSVLPGELITLLPAALSIAIVILAQSSSVIRSLGGEHDDKIRLNQDLFALGIANAVSALTRGFAVNGSPPRSYAADYVGGKSQMTNIMMGCFIGLLLLFGANLFTNMPEAALASIVFMLGFKLIRFEELRHIWSTHRTEFFVAMIALGGTALFGVRQGVLIAVIVSLMERLSRQYRPKDDILIRDGTLSDWAKERLGSSLKDEGAPDGLVVYSFDGSLFFENITYFVSRIHHAIDRAEKPVTYLLVDAGAIDSIDYTAVEELKALYRQLDADEIHLGFAHVSPNLFRQFDEFGVIDLVGDKNIFSTLSAAISAVPAKRSSVHDLVKNLRLKKGTYVVIGGAVLDALHLRQTNDVDLVVDDETYELFRETKHWKEFTQANGKKVLTHDEYNMMKSWMGQSLSKLLRNSFEVEGVAMMGIDDLIESKRHLARRKDFSDISLLRGYLQRHRGANGAHKSSQ